MNNTFRNVFKTTPVIASRKSQTKTFEGQVKCG